MKERVAVYCLIAAAVLLGIKTFTEGANSRIELKVTVNEAIDRYGEARRLYLVEARNIKKDYAATMQKWWGIGFDEGYAMALNK